MQNEGNGLPLAGTRLASAQDRLQGAVVKACRVSSAQQTRRVRVQVAAVLVMTSPIITSRPKDEVKDAVDSYGNYHDSYGGEKEGRKKAYMDMVNKYYDLATSFYEYGWGQSFHFAHRWKNETHDQSIKRHEHYLALKLGLNPNSKVLDVGCGIGGPMREIALFSGAAVVGINNNEYQIKRAEALNRAVGHGLSERCSFVKADFMQMPFPDNTFDAVYEIDATCHAPDAVACYKEILRVLKPGGRFAGYEWCSTSNFNPEDKEQCRILAEVELGNGLPEIRSTKQVDGALATAGFVLEEAEDLALSADIPWWRPLAPGLLSVSGFRTSTVGRLCTRALVYTLECLGVAPAGSAKVSNILERAGDGLVASGKAGIFTPLYLFVARKPLTPVS